MFDNRLRNNVRRLRDREGEVKSRVKLGHNLNTLS